MSDTHDEAALVERLALKLREEKDRAMRDVLTRVQAGDQTAWDDATRLEDCRKEARLAIATVRAYDAVPIGETLEELLVRAKVRTINLTYTPAMNGHEQRITADLVANDGRPHYAMRPTIEAAIRNALAAAGEGE